MKKILLFWGLALISLATFSQTTLGPGDIAFLGINTDGATDADDNFAFILLKDVDAATQIIFTDRGWTDGVGFWSTTPGDGEFTWTSGSARSAGEVIILDFDSFLPQPSFSFTQLGDQLFAIQGSLATPTFIAGLHFNVVSGTTEDGNWDGAATSNTTSALPDALTTGETAIRLTGPGGIEQDNFQFSCTTASCPLSGTPEELRAIIHNPINWVSNNTTPYAGTVDPGFEVTVDTQRPFVTSWQTSTANESITIPTFGTGYNYTVDWGDGTSPTNETGNATHEYVSPGTYIVSIKGDFPRIYFNFSSNRNKILTIEQWGDIEWNSMERAFFGCENLDMAANDIPILNSVTSLAFMFADCKNLVGNESFNAWNTNSISDLGAMFSGALIFNQPLDNWDVSQVTNMGGLFSRTSFNQGINEWDVSNVQNMGDMFNSASSFNQPINNWDTSSVTSMGLMFLRAISFNQNIGTWNVSSVTNMSQMFDEVTLSIENYDGLLNGWAGQPVQPNISFSGGNSQYCDGEPARQALEALGWNITDGGANCPNAAPIFTNSNTASVAENQTSAIDVNASDDNDSEGSGLAYTFSTDSGGGVDNALFDLDAATGVVTFLVAPDFETPADDNTDNQYEIQVTVTDSGPLSAIQDITITVTDDLTEDTDGDTVSDADEDVDGDGDVTDDDSDADTTPDYLDTDDDGDGVLTIDEDVDGDGDPTNDDTDGDFTPNYLDDDDDGDGTTTEDEIAAGTDPLDDTSFPISCEVTIDTQPLDVTTCALEAVSFSVTASGTGALSYQWQVSVDGTIFSDIGDPSALTNELNLLGPGLPADGNTYRVIVTSNNGTPGDSADDCSGTSDAVTLTVNPLPTVTFTALADLCIDAGIRTGLGGGTPAQGPSAGDFGVYSGPGVTDDGNGMTYSFDPAVAGVGTHTLKYSYVDGIGCSGSSTDLVEVFALPVVTFTALADLAVDAGVQTNLGGGNPVGGVYSGIGVTDNGDSTYDFDPSVPGVGTHTITYTYSNNNGCSNSASDDVEVLPSLILPEILINEALINPIGSDNSNEYLEFRGTPNLTLPTGIYLLVIEGDGNGGMVDKIFDLSGMTTGSNGYLVLLQDSSPYTVAAGATVITATGSGWDGIVSPVGDIENGSNSFLLIYSPVPPIAEDVDANDDGIFDSGTSSNWLIIDSIGILDGGATDIAYASLNFSSDGTGISSGTIVNINSEAGSTFAVDYLARNGDTFGSIPNDWVASNLSGAAPNWTIQKGGSFPTNLGGSPLNHLGSTNIFTPPVTCEVTIDTQPTDQTACDGGDVTFSVTASGTGTLSYRWGVWDPTAMEVSSGSPAGSTIDQATFSLSGPQVPAAASGTQFAVEITDDNGTPGDTSDDCSITSVPVTMTVNELPVVTLDFLADVVVNFPLITNLGGGAPEQGTEPGDLGVYSGPGVIDDGNGLTFSFDPALAGEGPVTITYTYTKANGCTSSASDEILVLPARPLLAISDVTQLEGTGGTTTFVFELSLSEPSPQTVTVRYQTIDNFAVSPDDYDGVPLENPELVIFNAGDTSKNISINVVPDSEIEQDETFFVQLTSVSGGVFSTLKSIGTGTILNDDAEGCTAPSNVALNKPSSQSSTYGNGIASFANDGNLSGSSPWDADLQHTNDDSTGPWWEVDLGSDHDLEEVVIHNRTNGFQDRLSDFYVFVSDAPFSASATASDLVGDASVWNYYFEGPAGALETIPSDVNGRYVRIQLSGQGFLHMAELEVMGCPSGPDVCEGAEPVMITAAGPFLDSGSPEQLVASPAGGTWSGQISATGLFDPSIGAGDYIITYSYTNGDGCTQSDTVTIMVDRDNDVPETCDGSDNVALNKPASQSSTYGNGEAFYANDGNLEGGSPWSADLQHTVSGEAQPWWEVDLGSVHDLTEVKIYNRTNRLQGRLNNFFIFVSDTPFSGSLLDQLGDANIESIYFEGEAGLVESFATMASGRYVRIQLQGSGTLHMAEVEVYGCPTDPSICDGSLPVTIAPAGPFLDTEGEQQLIGSPLGGTWSGAVSSDGIFNPSALGAGNYEATYTFTNENGCTKSDTITIVVNNEGGSACTEAYNLALDGTASHSSTYGNGEAFYANDGNQSGSSPWSADLQHTLDEDSQPWWEVDLGEMATIERVVIYNRTDKLQSRLNNFYVLYSDSPFGTQSLDELLADTNIGREFFSGAAGLEEEFTVDVMARYVRVQKTGSGPLHMAEVEVYGCPFAAPSLRANLNTFNVWPNPASEDAKASFENPTNVLSLMIYDMQGRIVKVYAPSELNAGMVMDLNVNTLAPGVYIIRTEDERGIHFEKQLVIKR